MDDNVCSKSNMNVFQRFLRTEKEGKWSVNDLIVFWWYILGYKKHTNINNTVSLSLEDMVHLETINCGKILGHFQVGFFTTFSFIMFGLILFPSDGSFAVG